MIELRLLCSDSLELRVRLLLNVLHPVVQCSHLLGEFATVGPRGAESSTRSRMNGTDYLGIRILNLARRHQLRDNNNG
jgi:hypothetical protein